MSNYSSNGYGLPYGLEDVLNLLQVPYRINGRNQADIDCILCGGKKKLNLNFNKQVFRCNKCGEARGNASSLYTLYTGVEHPYREIVEKLNIGDVADVCYSRKQFIPPPEPIVRNINERDSIYRAMVSKLNLLPNHKQDLLKRGLPDDIIEQNGYVSLPTRFGNALASLLLQEGYNLHYMPGFYTDKKTNEWKFIDYYSGYLIPVRDIYGQIQGFQLRNDNPNDPKRKYIWMSTDGDKNGTKCFSYVHFAMDFINNKAVFGDEVILTEGPLKADIAHYFSKQPFIAVAGVNALTELDKVLFLLKEGGVKKILVAYDMDYLTNTNVKKAESTLYAMIRQHGMSVDRLTWDTRYKGIDDYLYSLAMCSYQ